MNRFVLILIIVFASIFLISGLAKLWNLADFRMVILNLQLFPHSIITYITYLVPIIEIIIGIFILTKKYLNISIFIGNIILLIFTSLAIEKIMEGANIDCGCFGKLIEQKLDYITILRNVIFIIIGNFIFYRIKKNSLIELIIWEFSILFVGLSLISNLSLSYQNRLLKKNLDYILNENKKNIVTDTIRNFKIYDKFGTYQINFPSQKNIMIFVMKSNCEVCSDNYEYWVELFNNFRKTNYEIIGINLDEIYDIENEFLKTLLFLGFKKYNISYNESAKLNIQGSPQTIIIDTLGIIRENIKGVLDENKVITLTKKWRK